MLLSQCIQWQRNRFEVFDVLTACVLHLILLKFLIVCMFLEFNVLNEHFWSICALLHFGVLFLKELLVICVFGLITHKDVLQMVFLHSLQVVLRVTHFIIRNLIIIRTFEKIVSNVITIRRQQLTFWQISQLDRLVQVDIIDDIWYARSAWRGSIFEARVLVAILKEKAALVIAVLKWRRYVPLACLEHL